MKHSLPCNTQQHVCAEKEPVAHPGAYGIYVRYSVAALGTTRLLVQCSELLPSLAAKARKDAAAAAQGAGPTAEAAAVAAPLGRSSGPLGSESKWQK